MKKQLIKEVILINDKIKAAGFECFIVGGAVRNALLGLPIKDYDLVTNATPDDLKNIFVTAEAYFSTFAGNNFGVSRIRTSDHEFEVATFRKDGIYIDGVPESISFTNAEEDVKRRDLTINGLLYNIQEDKIIDYVGGLEDIKNQTIRFIGNAEDRIMEDPLRILRAVRIGADLGFKIETETRLVLSKRMNLIAKLPKERLQSELIRIVRSKNQLPGFSLLFESGAFDLIYGSQNSFSWIRKLTKPISSDLFYILDSEMMTPLFTLINKNLMRKRKFQYILVFNDWKCVKYINEESDKTDILDYVILQGGDLDKVTQIIECLKADPISIDLAPKGKDLVSLGFPQGKIIAETIEKVEKMIYTRQIKTKEQVTNILKSHKETV